MRLLEPLGQAEEGRALIGNNPKHMARRPKNYEKSSSGLGRLQIKRLEATNFRSFQKCSVDLGALNVIVGQNGAGKSSFVSILKFLKHIASDGLDNAVSMLGGMSFLRNVNSARNESTKISIVTENPFLSFDSSPMVVVAGNPQIYPAFFSTETTYSIELTQGKTDDDFVVNREFLRTRFYVAPEGLIALVDARENDSLEKILEKHLKGQPADIAMTRRGGDLEVEILGQPENLTFEKNPLLGVAAQFGLSERSSILEPSRFLSLNSDIQRVFRNLPVYSFDPEYTKGAVSISGRTELDEDGENLALVVRNILRDAEQRERFELLVSDALPFVRGINVQNLPDMTRLVEFSEAYNSKALPAAFISDGTICVVAILVALFFQDNHAMVFEEPERHIHPALLSKVAGMMYDCSARSQVILTTQSSSLLDSVNPKDVLFVSRAPSGESRIGRVADTALIRSALENDLSLGDLHSLDFLGQLSGENGLT